ncbi:hypothetical protein [Tolypothrix sp. VBCCA 56010]
MKAIASTQQPTTNNYPPTTIHQQLSTNNYTPTTIHQHRFLPAMRTE